MKKLLFVFFLSLSLIACDNDDEPTIQGNPIENLIGSGSKKWKLTAANADIQGGDLDLILNFPCWGDNVLTLKTDGTYTLEDLGQECVPKQETIIANWTLIENPLQIKLGKVNIMGYMIDNLVLNLTEVRGSKFSGYTGKVSIGPKTADKVEMTFVEVK